MKFYRQSTIRRRPRHDGGGGASVLQPVCRSRIVARNFSYPFTTDSVCTRRRMDRRPAGRFYRMTLTVRDVLRTICRSTFSILEPRARVAGGGGGGEENVLQWFYNNVYVCVQWYFKRNRTGVGAKKFKLLTRINVLGRGDSFVYDCFT